ncbi:UNVERIFIED_CONTAM: hypothetical protein K2H54_025896 [Gekko kuhli]
MGVHWEWLRRMALRALPKELKTKEEEARNLRRGSLEEWPLSHLARSFNMSPNVITRMLESCFLPSPEWALMQAAN